MMNDHRINSDDVPDMEDRHLITARMLPPGGPLTSEQREDVRVAVVSYMQEHNISQRQLSRQTDIAVSVLSKVLGGTYEHPADGHLRALNDWMEIDARRRLVPRDESFVETGVAKRIMSAAMRAIQLQVMVCVHGPSGVGNSMCDNTLAQKYTGSILLRLSVGNVSYTAIRRLLSNNLRMKGDFLTTRDELIFDKLRGSNRLLIIDEAHRISDKGLSFLRDIYDETGVGIILLCTKDLLDRIRCDADVDRGQLYSRIARVVDVTRGYDKVPGGNRPLFTVSEIRALYESDKVRLHPDAQAFLQDVANELGFGSLRRCKAILAWGLMIERATKGLERDASVQVTGALLVRAERDSFSDQAMIADIEARTAVIAKTA